MYTYFPYKLLVLYYTILFKLIEYGNKQILTRKLEHQMNVLNILI